jgi:hypothetical protein
MTFHLAQPMYPYNLGKQSYQLTQGGPSSGMTPAGRTPWPRQVGAFSTLQGLPYGTASSSASPQPWNNRYARPFQVTIAGGLQKAPTYTSVVF